MQADILSRNQTKPECHHCPTEWHQQKALARIPVWLPSTDQDVDTQFQDFCPRSSIHSIVAWPLEENQTASTCTMAIIKYQRHGYL